MPNELLINSKTEKLEFNEDIANEKLDYKKNFENKAPKLIFSKIPNVTRIQIKKIAEVKIDRSENPNSDNFGLDLLKSLIFMILGVILILYAFTKQYPIGLAFLLGIICFFWGIGIFIFVLFKLIVKGLENLIERKTSDKVQLRKKKKEIKLILGIISLLFLGVALLIGLFGEIATLFLILFIVGLTILLFSLAF